MSKESRFELFQATAFADMIDGKKKTLPRSDLSFQTDTHFLQFKYIEEKPERRTYRVSPGFHSIVKGPLGLETDPMEFRNRTLVEEIAGTSAILKEARTFFSRLDIYEKLKRPKKRGVLLYSAPGLGKTASIEKFCTDFQKEDPGVVVFVWQPTRVDAQDFLLFLSNQVEYTDECTNLVLIIEDIGGPIDGRRDPVDTSLLNLLDGVGVIFRLPTFIVATTNHPETLLASLANRPGRFDLMLKVEFPSFEERVKLLSFFAGRELTESEKDALSLKGADEFSVAHLEEVVVRSMLHDKSFEEVIGEMIDHAKKFNKAFIESTPMGFGN